MLPRTSLGPILVSFALSAAACASGPVDEPASSSTSNLGVSGGESGESGEGESGEGKDGPAIDAGAGASEGAVCAPTTNKELCVSCCRASHGAGLDVYLRSVRDRACTAAACETSCSTTFCAAGSSPFDSLPRDSSSPCLQCVGAVIERDYDALVAECRADAACARYLGCTRAACR